MSDSKNDIESALKSIASSATRQSIQSSYNDAAGVMKEFGAPSNNMLLSAIHGEVKRNADELLKTNNRISKLESLLTGVYENTERMCELMEQQNILLSSQHMQAMDGASTPPIGASALRPRRQIGDAITWHYDGFKLTSKTKVLACIICQFMNIVRLQMERRNIRYPDSVDCKFTTLDSCISESSKMRCTIPGITFKGEIPLPEVGTPASDAVLPLVASANPNTPTTLPESRLVEFSAPMMRELMLAIERVLQRLCKLDHILSPQQIDILRSIKIPIVVPGSDGELNWDSSIVTPRNSNPLCNQVASLSPTGKKVYIQEIIRAQSAMQAWTTAMEKTRK